MVENVPNLAKETNIRIQGAKSTQNKISLKKTKPNHIIIEFQKTKDIKKLST